MSPTKRKPEKKEAANRRPSVKSARIAREAPQPRPAGFEAPQPRPAEFEKPQPRSAGPEAPQRVEKPQPRPVGSEAPQRVEAPQPRSAGSEAPQRVGSRPSVKQKKVVHQVDRVQTDDFDAQRDFNQQGADLNGSFDAQNDFDTKNDFDAQSDFDQQGADLNDDFDAQGEPIFHAQPVRPIAELRNREPARPTAQAKSGRKSGVTLLLAIVLVAIALAWPSVYFLVSGMNDADNIVGTWRIANTDATVEITSTEIALTDNTRYTYEMNSTRKTLDLRFTDKVGTSRYRFSFDRSMLAIDEESTGGIGSFFENLTWCYGSLVATIAGKELSPGSGWPDTALVLTRTASPAAGADVNSDGGAAGNA